jgi:hypothetical protein
MSSDYSSKMQWISFFFGIIFLVIGLLILRNAPLISPLIFMAKSYGKIQVTGKVIRKGNAGEVRKKKDGKFYRARFPWIYYEFIELKTKEKRIALSEDGVNLYHIGDPIQVFYHSKRPMKSFIKVQRHWIQKIVFIILGLISFFFSGSCFYVVKEERKNRLRA